MSELLFTLAYPELEEADRHWIEDFRRAHDLPFRDVVAAHVTLAFGHGGMARAEYQAHVEEVAREWDGPIEFTCRYAMQGVDNGDARGYVFLVPDEGLSAIAWLHDRLYRGALAPALRLDIPYIPHITIGTLPSHREARDLSDRLNADGVHVAGRIGHVTVAGLTEGRVVDHATFALGG